jgi:hypothetical protein
MSNYLPCLARSLSLSTIVLLIGMLTPPRTATAGQGDCSQPVSTGASPVASDCLFILRVAVNLQACTPQACVCDPTGDGAATASDALSCLRKAVGEPTMLLCPCETTTSTTTTTMPSGANCTNDGNCMNDDCVCRDCDTDLFCSDPANCKDDGTCRPFLEGCVCADCMTHPECLDNALPRRSAM